MATTYSPPARVARCTVSTCMPTVAAERVLLAGCDGKLHAVNVNNGELVGTVDIGGPTGSTPAVHGNHAFFGTEQGVFFAISATDISVLWEFRDAGRRLGIRTAAAVDESSIVFSNQGRSVYALNPQSGEAIWQDTLRGRMESSPVIIGERVFLATSRGRLISKQLADGETGWEYDAGGAFYGSPAAVDNHLVIGNEDGTLYCFGRAAATR